MVDIPAAQIKALIALSDPARGIRHRLISTSQRVLPLRPEADIGEASGRFEDDLQGMAVFAFRAHCKYLSFLNQRSGTPIPR